MAAESKKPLQDKLDIPVDPNRRPVDEPKYRQQQQDQGRTPQMGGEVEPYLPPMPRKYPEPTD